MRRRSRRRDDLILEPVILSGFHIRVRIFVCLHLDPHVEISFLLRVTGVLIRQPQNQSLRGGAQLQRGNLIQLTRHSKEFRRNDARI